MGPGRGRRHTGSRSSRRSSRSPADFARYFYHAPSTTRTLWFRIRRLDQIGRRQRRTTHLCGNPARGARGGTVRRRPVRLPTGHSAGAALRRRARNLPVRWDVDLVAALDRRVFVDGPRHVRPVSHVHLAWLGDRPGCADQRDRGVGDAASALRSGIFYLAIPVLRRRTVRLRGNDVDGYFFEARVIRELQKKIRVIGQPLHG